MLFTASRIIVLNLCSWNLLVYRDLSWKISFVRYDFNNVLQSLLKHLYTSAPRTSSSTFRFWNVLVSPACSYNSYEISSLVEFLLSPTGYLPVHGLCEGHTFFFSKVPVVCCEELLVAAVTLLWHIEMWWITIAVLIGSFHSISSDRTRHNPDILQWLCRTRSDRKPSSSRYSKFDGDLGD